jgi:ERCC4-type nuclease
MEKILYLDTREADLIRILESFGNTQVKQLDVGDIWIGINEEGRIHEGGLVIERKSMTDFEASILDGRYREQRGRILAYCQENKAQPVYILEGALTSINGRLEKSAIIKFMNRLVLHYQIPILQTSSVNETAEIIKALQQQWHEEDSQKTIKKKTDLVRVTDGIHVKKKVNALDHKQFAISCLVQCPGVSVKIAEGLIDEFKTLKGVIEAPVKTIENIKIGTRRVGPAVAKRLHEILNQSETSQTPQTT